MNNADMEIIGKYQLHHQIAKGGMAEIFLATMKADTPPQSRQICVKRIRPEFSDDADFVQMFEQEARIAMALKHPNIVSVFDFDKHDGRLFLAMEYVEGWDVKQLLATVAELGATVPVGFAFYVFEKLVAALEAAQQVSVDGKVQAVVHRDISPHNILVSKYGDVKLTDFGIAKARGSSRVTRTGIIKGKLAYLSPEQATSSEVGPASDLYCAGLVLYEMLAGRRFQLGQSDGELLAAVMNPPRPEISWLSDEINQFLQVLLSREPSKRFSSPQDTLRALSSLRIPVYGHSDARVYCMGLITSAVDQHTGMIHTPVSSVVSESTFRPADEAPTRTSKQFPRSAGIRFFKPRRIIVIAFTVALVIAVAGWLTVRMMSPVKHISDLSASVLPATSERDVYPAEKKQNKQSPIGRPSAPVEDLPIVELAAAPDVVGPNESDTTDAGDAETVAVSAHGRASDGAAEGTLQVLCRPWAHISIDGKPVGTTPLRDRRLPVGKHEVRLRNMDLNYDKTVHVVIRKGKTVRVSESIEGLAAKGG